MTKVTAIQIASELAAVLEDHGEASGDTNHVSEIARFANRVLITLESGEQFSITVEADI